ncbi:hypothetical protein Tco_1011474 [Tanacetum coccineum]
MENEDVRMNHRCLALLLNQLPPKEKDPGSFILPCSIGRLDFNNALADLGASISIIPFSMYKRLETQETYEEITYKCCLTTQEAIGENTKPILGTSDDEDDIEGIIDYLEPTSYEGFIDLDDEEYNKRQWDKELTRRWR